MSRIANDNFEGSTLAPWWVPFQWDLLASSVVGSGYLQCVLSQGGIGDGHWYDDSTGPFLGQPVLGDFDVALECEPFDATFAGLPPSGSPRLVGIAAQRPQFAVTGTGPRGGITASDIRRVHLVTGYAPGRTAGSGVVTEDKLTEESSSEPTEGTPLASWETHEAHDPITGRAWLRLSRVGNTITYRDAASSGTPGSGPIPSSWRTVRTAEYPLLGPYLLVGVQLYTNQVAANLGARFYRILNVTG